MSHAELNNYYLDDYSFSHFIDRYVDYHQLHSWLDKNNKGTRIYACALSYVHNIHTCKTFMN